jgi:hypothetical protein
MGIRDYPAAPRSPWQNGHAERLISSIRRGMPRSHRRLRRNPSAPDSCDLHRLLQRTPNASVLGQGFSDPSAYSTAGSACRAAHPWRTSSSILSDIVSGRHRYFEDCNEAGLNQRARVGASPRTRSTRRRRCGSGKCPSRRWRPDGSLRRRADGHRSSALRGTEVRVLCPNLHIDTLKPVSRYFRCYCHPAIRHAGPEMFFWSAV